DTGKEFFIQVKADERPRAVNIRTLPYPGFPTDLQQPMTALLSVAYGNSFVQENLFEDRFNHVRELNRMGAKITVNGRTAAVAGVERLYGAEIQATDLRAGAAMIVAALMAVGTSIIRNVHFIDRGYEKLTDKLTALGAQIERLD
ncbi:MAG: UDP-N-acetylglucosamine 1-carboxyvinyltransferase, partial [Clostridia bacterium]|nr:UDP-N-acetylglucosamine 1-carboxyvinyltransferase [Clostridia bacterium]